MRRKFVAALAIAVAALVPVAAQERPQPGIAAPADARASEHIPLKVQLTLMRFKGEKKISSVPYMLGVLTNAQKTSLRMGVQVPVPMTVVAGKSEGSGAASVPQTSYTYRDVGTNIDCEAESLGSGLFNLVIAVDDSTLFLDRSSESADEKKIPRDIPAFRSFRVSFAILLRDGQTMQYAAATDPISGEVMRIEVSLSLAK
jgi:hypothetical protein